MLVDLVIPDSSSFRFLDFGLCLCWLLQFGSWHFWLPLLWSWCYFHGCYGVLWFGVLFELRVLELSSRSGGSQWWLHSGFVLGWAPVWCLFGLFWLLCVEHFWILDFIFGFASSSLICCSWGVLSFVCFWHYLCNKLDAPTWGGVLEIFNTE